MKRYVLILTTISLAACKGHEFHPPNKQEKVAAAEKTYSSVMFDTVTFASDQARLAEGNSVYAARCRKCHGPLGEGNTDYDREQNLQPPSLITPDWPYASSLDSVRHRIYVGHEKGMPTLGIAGISPREIDAVSHYVLEQLRPDALRARSTQ